MTLAKRAPSIPAAAQHRCFLCALDAAPCDLPAVEGTLAHVAERTPRAGLPAITLTPADGDPVTLLLPEHTRPLARDLAALPPSHLHALHIRAYHLRQSPTADASSSPTPHASAASAIVVEPDLLLNITDINNAEYCARQYPLRRMIPSPPTEATLRGTLLHQAFKELLKSGQPDPQPHLERALRNLAPDLALRGLSARQMSEAAAPHLEALAQWYTSTRSGLWGSAAIRAETFRLAPEVGLRGRLDILRTSAAGDSFIELKTGNAQANLPKREHRWQVQGYQTLLAVRQPGAQRAGATLLYSGTPREAEGYGIPFFPRDLHRVLDLRNRLALLHATGTVPPPPSAAKCARCMLRAECARASALLGWQPPAVDDIPPILPAEDTAAFAQMYEQLRLEARAAEADSALLWRLSPAERVAAGHALAGLEQVGDPVITPSGEWQYTFRCAQTSELREGDAILLSDGDPITGEVVSGTLLSVEEDRVTVWTPERIAAPALIDRYSSDTVHDRTVRNIWRWLDAEPRLRALAAGALAPTFDAAAEAEHLATLPTHFNAEQRRAIARALAAHDFLLIQGPPGTGKTAVVAEIAQRALQRGERVLIAAFTNQAVDTVLRRLVASGARDLLRLGHELSVAEDLRDYRLAPRAAARIGQPSDAIAPVGPAPEDLLATLRAAPLVAATTATWSAERHDGVGDPLRFDLAIIDEASQLTIPAILGALRFACRFVLVGDERQLPPLVRGEEAAALGLRRSLFSTLLERWGPSASVALAHQYRMHPTICGFPSAEFYGGALVAAGAARTSQLALALPADHPLALVLDPARPLVFVDIPDAETGKASRAQAAVAGQIVAALLQGGVDPTHIGVIAPYRAQVALIRQRLATLSAPAVQVDTVDRFQGAEREVILFASGGQIEPAPSTHAFLADPHRLNVALTRAQRKLIILGSRATFARTPLLARLLTYCAALYDGRGGLISARR